MNFRLRIGTLGHAIDNGKFYAESGADVQDVRNLRAERSSSNKDIRHRLVSSLLYDLPFGRGRRFLDRGVTGALAGGWRLAAIASLHGGLPFTPILSFDPTNSLAAARPDRLKDGNLPRGERTLQRFYDVSAFEAPRGFAFGNAGRNILRGRGSVNFDVGLHRSFRLGDRMRVELRAELFNAANTPQFADPGAVIGDPQAGAIQTTRARERQIQFGVKLLY